MGSYLAGYADPQGFTLGQAGADERRRILGHLRVTDGGVYDNLGLEPVWKSHRVVLVSDAGGLMDAEDDRSFFWRIKRYQEIQERQALGVRKRFLISGFSGGAICGAYVGVGSAASRYAGVREGWRVPCVGGSSYDWTDDCRQPDPCATFPGPRSRTARG